MSKDEELEQLRQENAVLRDQVAQLSERIHVLEARLAKESHNSHLPPSSDRFHRPRDAQRGCVTRMGRGVNRREIGKRQTNCVSLIRERPTLFLFPRKKTPKKYDTAESPYPNCPTICSLHTIVARRSRRSSSCVQPIWPAESHPGAGAICLRSYGRLRGD